MLSVFLKQFLSSCKHERDPDKKLLISPGLSRMSESVIQISPKSILFLYLLLLFLKEHSSSRNYLRIRLS